MRLFLASLFTFAVLASFIFAVVLLVLLYTESVDIGTAIGLTVIVNFVLWLIGPSITDLLNKWFYKVEFLTKDQVMARYPDAGMILEQVSSEYRFPFPKIGIINDDNPTTFTYGSARYNARIVITEGIFKFLNPQEVKSVIAHELGHVVNRDFIVMMIASTMLQILYEIYAVFARKSRSSNRKKGGLALVGLVAYLFYMIGVYVVYYLSRTREYLADEFAAKKTSAQDLSNALIKIAYGIVAAEDDKKSDRLLQSTRHLGIVDSKNAKHYGVMSYISHNDPNIISEVMVFDKVNPWAQVIELGSTHPLTGKRVDALSDIAKEQGHPLLFDVDGAINRMQIDKGKLYAGLLFGLFMMGLPVIFLVVSLLTMPIIYAPAAIGLGLLLQIPYKFPSKEPVVTTVLDEMRNPYASPIQGKPIRISGQVIGRGSPGYIFGEDMMYQDKTGLIFLNYVSSLGFLGNIMFALKKVKTLLNIPSTMDGWFYRGIGSIVSMKSISTAEEKVNSRPALETVISSVLLFAISLVMYIVLSG